MLLVAQVRELNGQCYIFSAFHQDAVNLFDITSDLRKICDKLHDSNARQQYHIEVFSHVKPMLLEECAIENVDKLFANHEKYCLQLKYDGERSQVHMKHGLYKYFTRQSFDITSKPSYGESATSGYLSGVFSRLLSSSCSSVILDGELMGWHKERQSFGSKGMNYDVKNLTQNSSHRPCFVAFDIIMYNDELLHTKSYEERLSILRTVFTPEEGCLVLAKSETVCKSDEVRKIFDKTVQDEEEGIVLKNLNATYKPNVRKGSNCYKIKAEVI